MKLKTVLTVLCAASFSGIASAFTINASVLGSPLAPVDATGAVSPGPLVNGAPVVINVPGYGSITLEAAPGSVLSYSGSPSSIRFNNGESLMLTFSGTLVTDMFLSTNGIGFGENLSPSGVVPGKSFTINFSGTEGGLTNITFDAVPEPSAAALGILGTALLVLRRRR